MITGWHDRGMKDMKAELSASDVLRAQTTTVRVTHCREAQCRQWLGMACMRMAARVMGTRLEIRFSDAMNPLPLTDEVQP